MSIVFHNADVRFKPGDKEGLKKFIEGQVARALKKKAVFSYVFCSDTFLLDINRKFLGHDFYTDIITFPLSQNEELIEAEIYISVDRVRDNAVKLGVDFEEEMYRVLFHGVLHLLGHKDKTKSQKEAMRWEEDKWLKSYMGK